MSRPILVTFVLALLALASAACSGDGSSTELEPTIAADTPESTAEPTATSPPQPTPSPPPTATPLPPTPPPPAPIEAFTPGPTCPPRTNNHLNIDLLRLQPGLTNAIITEIDDTSIQVEVQSAVFIITGVGKLVMLGGTGEASDELLTQMYRAIDAANRC